MADEREPDIHHFPTTGTPGSWGYDAYRATSDGKSLATGDDLPLWYQLPWNIRQAWEITAQAVIDRFLDDRGITLDDPTDPGPPESSRPPAG